MDIQKIILPESPEPLSGVPVNAWDKQDFWAAKWIAAPGAAAAAYACSFELASAETLRMHVCADSVYRLYCDGELAGEGPELGDPEYTYFDTFEWRCAPGRHTVCAVVFHLGSAASAARMSVRPGFILHAPEFPALDTNAEQWRCIRLAAFDFTATQAGAFGVGGGIVFDAAAFPEGIEHGLLENPQIPVEGERGGAGAFSAHSWGELRLPHLIPATLPALDRGPAGFRVRWAGEADSERRCDPITHDAALASCFSIPAGRHVAFLLELDDYCCCTVSPVVSGGKGATLSIGWAEALYQEPTESSGKGKRDAWEGKYFIGIFDCFLPDGREAMRFFTHHYRAGRFVYLEIETRDEPLHIHDLGLRERHYPVPFPPQIEHLEPSWKILAERCFRTLEMCSHDTFMDCPYYEQMMYLGDTRIQILLTMACGNDDRLVKKSLTLLFSGVSADGFFYSRYPSRMPQVIPTFTPFLIATLNDYRLKRGDVAFCRPFLAAARRAMDAFEFFFNDHGILELKRTWNFIDWVPAWEHGVPPKGQTGESAEVNAVALYGYAQLIELLAGCGEADFAELYQKKAARFAENFTRRFLDAETGLFRSAEGIFGEHAQLLSLLSNLLDPTVAARCAETFFHFDFPVRSTFYFDFYYFELCRKYGKTEHILARMKPFLEMEKLGFRTLPESWDPSRSDCHAWSAHPLYFMLSNPER